MCLLSLVKMIVRLYPKTPCFIRKSYIFFLEGVLALNIFGLFTLLWFVWDKLGLMNILYLSDLVVLFIYSILLPFLMIWNKLDSITRNFGIIGTIFILMTYLSFFINS